MADCSNCAHMKSENKQLRKNRDDIHKEYVEVCNQLLALRRELENRVSKIDHVDQ